MINSMTQFPPTDTGHRCLECDYNLTAITTNRCPECGWKIDWKLTGPDATLRKHWHRDVIRLTLAIVLVSALTVFALDRLNIWTPRLTVQSCHTWASLFSLVGHAIVLNELIHPSRRIAVGKFRVSIAIIAAVLQLITAILFIATTRHASFPPTLYALAILPGATLLVISLGIVPKPRARMKNRTRKSTRPIEHLSANPDTD